MPRQAETPTNAGELFSGPALGSMAKTDPSHHLFKTKTMKKIHHLPLINKICYYSELLL